MTAPLRVLAIADGETTPSWWLSRDAGITFRRSEHDQKQVRLAELSLVGHGLNDPQLTALFSRQRRVCFQAAGKYTDGT